MGPSVSLAGSMTCSARCWRAVWGRRGSLGRRDRVPGPVDFGSGCVVAPPIMPGWDGFPIRETFAARYNVPVWVDNDVNVMALGELRAGAARGHRTVVLVKIGTGIGAGTRRWATSSRRARICRRRWPHTGDPRSGCVVSLRKGRLPGGTRGRGGAGARCRATREGGFKPSAVRAHEGARWRLEAEDVSWAASHGDAASMQLIVLAGRWRGRCSPLSCTF